MVKLQRLLITILLIRLNNALNNCPASAIKSVIQRAAESSTDAVTQMQMIRRILEDIFGGTWGVLVIRNPALVSKEVHWTFPDHSNSDGTAAFCLAVINKWQYNVFKTGTSDSSQRMTVDQVIARFTSGSLPRIGKLGIGSSKNDGEMLIHKNRHRQEEPIESINPQKKSPKRYSVEDLDRMMAEIFDNEEPRSLRKNRSPRLVS